MEIRIGGTVFTPGRIFCIGRNYAAHAQELRNEIPSAPVIFCKPPTSLVSHRQHEIPLPEFGGTLHHEIEIVALIGKSGKPAATAEAADFIAGLAVGLDLTLRETQNALRQQGLPWEKAKSFDGSAPLGEFIPFTPELQLNNLNFACAVNGAVRQRGNTGGMLFPIPCLIMEIAKYWKLLPGDLIFTGTPAGAGPLHCGDCVEIAFAGRRWSWLVGALAS